MKPEFKEPRKIKVILAPDLWVGSANYPKPIEDVIKELQKVWEDNRTTHENIHIVTDVYEYDDYGHERILIQIVGERMENRSELLDRIEAEEKRETYLKEKMRTDYENLKKIFEEIGIDKHFESR